ncbi:hypothetical protein CRUP_010772, partial [Coryphaenoides rupestris]
NHSALVTDATVVPFLPGRQKLARFNAHEFATLVIDILTDAKRRQWGNSCESMKEDVELILKGVDSCHGSDGQDNDQPDYDSVASDEDPEREAMTRDDEDGTDRQTKSSESSDLSDGPITVQEFLEVKSALNASEAKIQHLMKLNCHLSEELRMMQGKLSSLQTENSSLRWPGPGGGAQQHQQHHHHHHLQEPPPPLARGGRPMSMYETGSASRPYPAHRGEALRHGGLALQPLPPNGCSLEGHGRVTEGGDYDNTLQRDRRRHSELEERGPSASGDPLEGPRRPEDEEEEEGEGGGGGGAADSSLPGTEDLPAVLGEDPRSCEGDGHSVSQVHLSIRVSLCHL